VRDDAPDAIVRARRVELMLHVCLRTMTDSWGNTTDGYSFRFFSPEQVDQILCDGTKRGRAGSHAAIERILKHEPELERAELWQRIRRLKTPSGGPNYRRSVWAAEDEKVLREGYEIGWRGKRQAVRELLKRHPDWRPHVIWRRAAKLGLVRKATKRHPERFRCPWSEDDDRVLLTLAGYKKLRMIAKLLHRSERGVRYRLAVLGKSSRVHVDGYARRALAEELHLGRKTIQRLIVEGLLEVRDPRITPKSIQALRKSGRLTSLQLNNEEKKGTPRTGAEQEPTSQRDVENFTSVSDGASRHSVKSTRAKGVWTEVARALNVGLETVEKLIAQRTLRLYDPRVTEKSFRNFCRRYGSLINLEFLDGETRDWLRSSMDLDRNAGEDAAARLKLFRKHALAVRRCTDCGRAIRGNAFFRHVKRCKGVKAPGSKATFPVDPGRNTRPPVGQSGRFTQFSK